MSLMLRIALAQINCTVGDLRGNAGKIADHIKRAQDAGARVVVFPEMAVSGYPPEDLLLKPSFTRSCLKYLQGIAAECSGIIAVIGFPEALDDLYNSAAVIADKEIVGVSRKHYLPNYGVFDEDRYFQAGNETLVFSGNGWTFGVSICEDIWYPEGPPATQALHGDAHLLINISASPYHIGKRQLRESMLSTRASDNTAAVAFCNTVGGQDELIFDGSSAVFDPRGTLLARGCQFREELVLADISIEDIIRQRLLDPRRRKLKRHSSSLETPVKRVPISLCDPTPTVPLNGYRSIEPLSGVAEAYQALSLGTCDYVRKNGFKKVVLGLSGGIDSSLVACIAADALGPDNVAGVSMPSRYSSQHSQDDAARLADALGIRFFTLKIDPIFRSYLQLLEPVFQGKEPDLTEENLQARIRGTILMALSNKFGWIVLTTGNKSETSTGFATLYGDMAGGFAVIKDVAKEMVYDLARHRNTVSPVIPEDIFIKPPSAELRPDQKDSDSLPEYRDLDPILTAYIEQNLSIPEIVAGGFGRETVHQVVRMVDRAEYKRRQGPPGIKITPRAFGKDRRFPITNNFKEASE
jgi:NAD+ synthase (glutamine-hydrolysing)